ncbi:Cof-type HAD-IIB family hydrolase [Vibrio spartinae]|uniref:Pyridoxal phosphate phosphatase YigL n=1 Tax=Vibrio spartinae TaxID=1918945 RepID=A0A1N6M9Y1_9VIBR|nr:Cof-type HAD-IIB family hydrolase [Vibrio spartinae]QMV15888.1 Pyridoxal phosphate phosphatase YigL [Vibrio spartinae]SIO96275.1 Pyridoxal phosphate phosphatase YigL [Vibrio spartinae]
MTLTSKDIRIVASDLDGTLLAPDHKLSPFTKSTLKDLHQKGYTFIFATGRHHIDVAGIREIAGIPAFMITSNGARIHSPDNQLMFSRNVPKELVQSLIDLCKDDPDIFIHIYHDDQWRLSAIDETIRQYHNESEFTFQMFDPENPPLDNVAKIFFTHSQSSHDALVRYEKILNQRFAGKVTIVFSSATCLEVMGPDISKGHALQVVANSLNHTLDHCIAFGDGMNDIEMLSMAGRGLIMETAHENVFSALPQTEHIGSHADDAVAHYLHQHLL